jgi:hypothetical protein
MKTVCVLLFTSVLLYSCGTATTADSNSGMQNTVQISAGAKAGSAPSGIMTHKLFTLADALKILGEPAHLADSGSTREGGKYVYRSSYKANSEDVKTGKRGAIYFMYEEYENTDSAKAVYAFIKTANQDHGIKVLTDMGDEAYYQGDNGNFHFVLARKGNKMYRMKVNKTTSNTSYAEFNNVARKIVSML